MIDAPSVPNGGNPGISEHCITSGLVETALRPGFFRAPRQAAMARGGKKRSWIAAQLAGLNAGRAYWTILKQSQRQFPWGIYDALQGRGNK